MSLGISNVSILKLGPITVSNKKTFKNWSVQAMKVYEAYLPSPSDDNQPKNYND
jgi:hypothetical protein